MDSRTIVIEAQRTAERARKARPPAYSCPATKAAALQDLTRRLPSVSTGVQMRRIVEALSLFPEGVSAIDMALHLDLPHPPSRIRSLRKDGAQISSNWVRQHSLAGVEHRTVLYVQEAADDAA